MFEVFLFNFGYALQDDYATREEAYAAGRACGFEFVVLKDGEIVR
jgi:hypothetical protein